MLQLLLKSPTHPIAIRRVPSFGRSAFSSGTARLAVDPAVVPKAPKRHRVRNFFLSSALIVGGFSVGAIYFSLKNDDFYYKFTGYVPFASIVVDTIDDFIFHRTIGSRGTTNAAKKSVSMNNSGSIVPVDGKSKAFAEFAEPSPAHIPRKEVPKTATVETSADSPAEPKTVGVVPSHDTQTEKPVDSMSSSNLKAAAPAAVGAGSVLAPADLPGTVDPTNVDPLLSEVMNAVNICLRAHEVDLKDDAFFSNLVAAVESASTSLTRERADLKARFDKELKESTATFLENADKEYLAAKLNLVESYNNRLQLALDAVTKKAVASANNKITAQYNELWSQFGHKIVEYVEQERDGRLSQIDELKKDVETLQEAMLSSQRILESEDGVVSFFVELGNLQRILSKQEVVPLKPYIDALTRALPSDPLVQAAASSIAPSVKKYGVLSHAQLAARFSLIEPKIRQASLAPPDAGIAGHLSSLAASQLLARKEGLPEGKDVESIIARTHTHLQQGDILRAVAEVNSLQGWPKKIAADWLDEARKRSEVEFLATVLSDEGRLWSISRN